MHQVLANIRNIRIAKGYSQEYVAERIEISQSSYTRFESGRSKTLYEIIEKVADFFTMSVTEVITYHKSPGYRGGSDSESLAEDSATYRRLSDDYFIINRKVQLLESNYNALSLQVTELQKVVQRKSRRKK